MAANLSKRMAEPSENGAEMQEAAPPHGVATDDGLDVSLLEDSLAKTPWERMQANDDALRLAESLRAAMEQLDARPQRTDAPTD